LIGFLKLNKLNIFFTGRIPHEDQEAIQGRLMLQIVQKVAPARVQHQGQALTRQDLLAAVQKACELIKVGRAPGIQIIHLQAILVSPIVQILAAESLDRVRVAESQGRVLEHQ
jgi:hypothetical protein